MTTVIGVLCSDGAVIGTDSAVTFGVAPHQLTIKQPTEKLHLGDSYIIAGTGEVGMGQRFCALVGDAYKSNKVFSRHGHIDAGVEITKLARAQFAATQASMASYGAMLAYSCGGKPHICQYAVKDFQPEWLTEKLWYASMGSGQGVTDPLLGLMRRVFWNDGQPNVADATFAVTFVLQQAIELVPNGVDGPMRIATLEKEDGKHVARQVEASKLELHQQNVEAAISHFRRFMDKQEPESAPTEPIPEL